MSIMCSTVRGDSVVLFELGVGANGNPVYRISWYNGEIWSATRYHSFNEARATYRMISRMI